MKYLHLFTVDENDKFSLQYAKFIEKDFNIEEHIFYTFGNEGLKGKINPKLLKNMYTCKQIYLHGFSSGYLALLFCLMPWLLKKTKWLIWGGDLYFHKFRERSIKNSVNEILRKFVIRNMSGIITQLYGDFKLAQKWYDARGKYHYSFMYPSNLYKDLDISKIYKEEKVYIQVGNSACPTNEHIEVFEILSSFKNQEIKIICPLSYSGNQDYIDKVISKGYEIFGKECFMPILDFMPFQNYIELLGKVDVAIFNHRRQRGLGNITTLLGLGKKVFIREETTTWNFCKNHGLKVYSANNNLDSILKPMSDIDKEMNHKIMCEQFSEKKLVLDWEKIFSAY